MLSPRDLDDTLPAGCRRKRNLPPFRRRRVALGHQMRVLQLPVCATVPARTAPVVLSTHDGMKEGSRGIHRKTRRCSIAPRTTHPAAPSLAATRPAFMCTHARGLREPTQPLLLSSQMQRLPCLHAAGSSRRCRKRLATRSMMLRIDRRHNADLQWREKAESPPFSVAHERMRACRGRRELGASDGRRDMD